MLMDGRLEEAIDAAQRICSRGEEAGVALMAKYQADLFGIRARIYLGRSLDILEGEIRVNVEKDFLMIPAFCLVLSHLGRKDEVSTILERRVVRRPGIGTVQDETHIQWDSAFLEAAILTGHRTGAELILNRFSGTCVCTPGIYYSTCIPRHLGGAAALLGRYEEARRHYQEAIRICTEMRFRPELALTRLQLAELLLEHFPQEKSEAIAHLDFVIPEFRDMKMQPSLERALRHKEILKA
jgi:tetratricopeptide (TPR) repeat protein